MRPEEKQARRKIAGLYYSTIRGRAAVLGSVYRRIDKKRGRAVPISTAELEKVITRPCVYCGDSTAPRGADRIDNSRGHGIDNIVPACCDCNRTRADRFTHAEMFIIGKAVAQIKANRSNL
jgi:hypothetical protein